MSDIKLGQLAPDENLRDAIHIALIAVTAGEDLNPGTHVGVLADKTYGAPPKGSQPLGVVDPFLSRMVERGDRFWLCLYQNTVTGMRHVWQHPAFSDEASGIGIRSAAEEWIRRYADSLDIGYSTLMDGADQYLRDGDYLCQGGTLEGERTSDEFWRQYAIATGTPIDPETQGNFFTCSC